MAKEFPQITWDLQLQQDLVRLIELAVLEDLGRESDWTTVALVPLGAQARAQVVARQSGCVSGLQIGPVLFGSMNCKLEWYPVARDGDRVHAGSILAEIEGDARDLLTAERILLNFLGRLSGISTLTSQFVDRVQGTAAGIYDTRKTLPGWRRLEKYAVRCGGGRNHRLGLHEAILIKDNHLSFLRQQGISLEQAVPLCRQMCASRAEVLQDYIVEIEVDTLEQLPCVLKTHPDIVLLDNFSLSDMESAVQMRNQIAPQVQLEASGGVGLDSVARIASTGVERISVGAITHSAPYFDVALDW